MLDLNQTEDLNIASAPYGEDCAQVGSAGYEAKARKECRALRNQLIRMHGNPPLNCTLVVKSFPHDFGTYYEVCARYDCDNEAATEYAFKLESETPEYWDKEAKKELAAGSEVIGTTEEKIPVIDVPLTMDSIVEVECPFCGEARSVEPDANYQVTCDCGKKYWLRSEI